MSGLKANDFGLSIKPSCLVNVIEILYPMQALMNK